MDGAAAVAGLAATRALRPELGEPAARSLARLAAATTAATAVAGVGAHLVELGSHHRGGRLITLAATVGTWAASYALTHPGKARAGSADTDGGAPREDVTRVVSLPTAMGMGPMVTVSMLGLGAGRIRAQHGVLAGWRRRSSAARADDRRTAGRALTLAAFAGLGWAGLRWVNGKLTTAGESLEQAHASAPSAAEVTGGPGSTISWGTQSRESRRWLSMALRPQDISHVMGEPARQPIRVYASLESAASSQERAERLLAEIDRTGALDRPVFALFSPTGSGYVNYVATETLEYLTRGNCASAAIQYSVLPSALSLGKVHEATAQTRIVVNGIVQRLLSRPADRRPRFLLFGESLGSQVSQEMFAGQGLSGPSGIGLDAAVWIGTPAATVWRTEIDNPDITATPVVQDGVFVTRGNRDWAGLTDDDRASVRYLLLQNGDDPIPEVRGDVAVAPAVLAGSGRHPPARRTRAAPAGCRSRPSSPPSSTCRTPWRRPPGCSTRVGTTTAS